MNINRLLSNKVLLYLATRYITYGLQFITSILLASKLGPELFGRWSFVLLLFTIFNIIDFGTSNSISVLLVQNKDRQEDIKKYIGSAIIINGIMSFMVVILCYTAYIYNFQLLVKYNVQEYLPLVCFVVVASYYNKTISAIYRVYNRLLEVAFYQSVIPVLLFIGIVIFPNINDLWLFVIIYVLGNLLSILLFLTRINIIRNIQFDKSYTKVLFEKGFWLFFYNSSFYLIFYLSSFIVSISYSVGIYGKFNFVHTLSNAVILLIDAFSFIIFPKVIDKLKSSDKSICQSNIYNIRVNYTTLVCVMIYGALPLFRLVFYIAPQYSDTDNALCVSALSLIPYAFCFGINSFLIAQNKELNLAIISFVCLIVNTIMISMLVFVFDVDYSLIFISILLSYVLFTLLCTKAMLALLEEQTGFSDVLRTAFPVRSVVPFCIAVTIALFSCCDIIWLMIPFICFVAMNYRRITIVFGSIVKIINKPTIVDL